MKKLIPIIVLLLSVVALTAVMPVSSEAHRAFYGTGWGYAGYSYPVYTHSYGWGPRVYTTWPRGVYTGYGVVVRPAPAYRAWWYY